MDIRDDHSQYFEKSTRNVSLYINSKDTLGGVRMIETADILRSGSRSRVNVGILRIAFTVLKEGNSIEEKNHRGGSVTQFGDY